MLVKVSEFWELGLVPFAVSAISGYGTGELLDQLIRWGEMCGRYGVWVWMMGMGMGMGNGQVMNERHILLWRSQAYMHS